LLLDALKTFARTEFEIVGVCADGETLAVRAQRCNVSRVSTQNVVVLDIAMPHSFI